MRGTEDNLVAIDDQQRKITRTLKQMWVRKSDLTIKDMFSSCKYAPDFSSFSKWRHFLCPVYLQLIRSQPAYLSGCDRGTGGDAVAIFRLVKGSAFGPKANINAGPHPLVNLERDVPVLE